MRFTYGACGDPNDATDVCTLGCPSVSGSDGQGKWFVAITYPIRPSGSTALDATEKAPFEHQLTVTGGSGMAKGGSLDVEVVHADEHAASGFWRIGVYVTPTGR